MRMYLLVSQIRSQLGRGLGHRLEVCHHILRRHHIRQVNVDIQQVDHVHDLAALTDRLAGDDDAEGFVGVAAGGVHAVGGGHACAAHARTPQARSAVRETERV